MRAKKACASWLRTRTLNLRTFHDRFVEHGRNGNGESRAAVYSVAFDLDRSAVQFYQVAHDRQSKPQTAMFARRRAVRLTKSVKNKWKELGLDADATETLMRECAV